MRIAAFRSVNIVVAEFASSPGADAPDAARILKTKPVAYSVALSQRSRIRHENRQITPAALPLAHERGRVL
jgi:hypothetical protein